jgi:uncharacterized NAD(P)/FAD-binding protein YdhS
MSAFPEDPQHFVRWLLNRGLAGYSEKSFVPRMIYGDYLEDVLDEARAGASARCFEHVRTKAVGLECGDGGVRVRLATGMSLSGDLFVLALGNQAPAPWPNLPAEIAESGRYFGLTWTEEAVNPSDPQAPILLLGTGLTAIDAVLALRHNGHRGPLYMASRRGLVPTAHLLSDCTAAPPAESYTARESVAKIRAAARDSQIVYGNWRVAVDGVRPKTNELWQALSFSEQKRFLRHARPYWDVHRHRMAPEIASAIASLVSDQTLHILAGRIGQMQITPTSIEVSVQRRGSSHTERLAVDRVINCTGPEANPSRIPDPLIQYMIQRAYLEPHPLRTGILVDNDGALIGADGKPSTTLFAMGPLRWGTLLETVAMPEIRDQASQLSFRLAKRQMIDTVRELVGAV